MTVGERTKLKTEVERFSLDMKIRLLEKEKQGYKGWDEKNMIDDLAHDMALDANTANELISVDKITDRKLFIDIANRAMFLARFCEY